MSTAADTYVRARIDTNTKERAASALEAMGLSISDAIRLLMLRIADEHRLPFEVKVPNATTKEAIAELEAGSGFCGRGLSDRNYPYPIQSVGVQKSSG